MLCGPLPALPAVLLLDADAQGCFICVPFGILDVCDLKVGPPGAHRFSCAAHGSTSHKEVTLYTLR